MPLSTTTGTGGDLPLPLGGAVAVGEAADDIDVLIDGAVPFWLAISEATPYQRATAQSQRQQVDQAPEAGEQTLSGWWLRSQMSFHHGAGLDYLDTSANPVDTDRNRFKASKGVDVWTPGTVSRLHASPLQQPTGGARALLHTALAADGTQLLVMAAGTALKIRTGSTWANVAYGSTSPIQSLACDGAQWFAATREGVYRGNLEGTTTGAAWYTWTATANPVVIGYVKQRLMLGIGPAVYELDGVATPALPDAKLTHPVPAWRWVGFSETPQAIVAGGYAGISSALYQFRLEDVSGTPTLGAGSVLASLPAGERVHSLLFYVGSLLVLGTSRGIRVASFDTFSGSIALGPLSYESSVPVQALAGYDRFAYGGAHDGDETCLVRLDLGAQMDQAGRVPWAHDLLPDTAQQGAVTAIAVGTDGKLAWAVDGYGVLQEGDTFCSCPAWLQTARIRFATVEDKNFAYGRVRGALAAANTIAVDVSSAATPGVWTPVFTNADGGNHRFGLKTPPAEWVALRFNFAGNAELSSYQVQATPAQPRQRLVAFPVWVRDREAGRSGREFYRDGWGLERLALIEAIERSGAEIQVQAPALFPESFRGTVESLQFTQATSPSPNWNDDTGGVLTIVIRTTS